MTPDRDNVAARCLQSDSERITIPSRLSPAAKRFRFPPYHNVVPTARAVSTTANRNTTQLHSLVEASRSLSLYQVDMIPWYCPQGTVADEDAAKMGEYEETMVFRVSHEPPRRLLRHNNRLPAAADNLRLVDTARTFFFGAMLLKRCPSRRHSAQPRCDWFRTSETAFGTCAANGVLRGRDGRVRDCFMFCSVRFSRPSRGLGNVAGR